MCKCFQCGIEIYDWLTDDNPWIEHAKYAPQCLYVRFHQKIGFIMAAPYFRHPIVEACVTAGYEKEPVLKAVSQYLIRNDGNDAFDGPTLCEMMYRGESEIIRSYYCNICMCRQKNTLCLPCHHLCCCWTCGQEIKRCPICRHGNITKVRVFYC